MGSGVSNGEKEGVFEGISGLPHSPAPPTAGPWGRSAVTASVLRSPPQALLLWADPASPGRSFIVDRPPPAHLLHPEHLPNEPLCLVTPLSPAKACPWLSS